MKNTFLILCILFGSFAYGQTNNLKFILVTHEDVTQNDILLKAINNFITEIKKSTPNFNYSSISYKPIDFMNSPNLVGESTIGSMKAANFIQCNKKLQQKLIPILIVKKNNQELPYYNSYFIINKNSNIKSLNSPEIKKLYYVDEQSGSGYFIPIHSLWEAGVISQPSLKSAKEQFGETNVIKAGSHPDVIQDVSNDKAYNSVGLCGEAPASTSNATVLLRCSLIPQDVIFVSQDLKQFIPQIKDWFKKQTEDGVFKNTSTRITGVEDFGLEYEAAYIHLEKIIDRVETIEKSPDKTKFKFNDLNTPDVFFEFVKQLKFTEIATIIGAVVMIFGAGITIGIKYPGFANLLRSNTTEATPTTE